MRRMNRALTPAERSAASERIAAAAERLPAFGRARTVALFCSLADEPDTGAVLRRWSDAKRLAVPRVEGETMRFCRYDPAAMRPGAFGIEEPGPEVRIEELELPFAAVAADLLSGSEVVFERGGLYEAIRASIAIPSVFRPVHRDGMVLVDGGTVNLVPLNRVRRTKDDLLVAVNVSAPYRANPALRRSESFNFYKLLVASSQIMQQRIAQTMNDLYRPEVLVQIPADSYGIFEFYRAAEIIEAGRLAASAALDDYAAGRASRGVRAGCVESEPEPAEA